MSEFKTHASEIWKKNDSNAKTTKGKTIDKKLIEIYISFKFNITTLQ